MFWTEHVDAFYRTTMPVINYKQFKLNTITYIIAYVDTIYQPLRSGRIWHKVNF